MIVGEWTRGPAIGRGSSAVVSLAVDRVTGVVFAVKSVGAGRAAELRREQSILRGLSSPYVVRCLGYVADGSGEMLMEYAAGGSLADEIRRCGGRCPEALIRCRARDVLRGLAHAHGAGVAHCDVKARNVLVGSHGRAMLADFGCARRIVASSREPQLMGMGGTPMFMAPEAARGEERGAAADVWAVGCTVIEMATGGAPWRSRFADPVAALHHVAFSGEAPELPPWLSEAGKEFLGRCLRQDPRERWTAEQLLEHPWFLQADADAVSCSSSFLPGITGKETTFVSPKSVLDQVPWDDDDTRTGADNDPTDRVRALSGGGAPDWTWDGSWITVHSGDNDDHHDAMWADQPEVDADTTADSDPLVGGSAGRPSVGISNGHASHGNGDSYDDTSSSCDGRCAVEVNLLVPFIEPRASPTGINPFRWLDRRLTPTSSCSVFLCRKLTPPSAPPLHHLAHKPDADELPAQSSSAVLLCQ
ncbi:hypothetical protein BRADI_1g41850v3 [Brachypodium distachyon]|uniref:Protein kinase domain-containing protein n=1 Tax=Brachypodium distachyon TaxID=15368 RepID=A0A0Q3H5Y8_BRADI|nr:hypothetical protein BRADI_1g41850v3 [Brachypodium distachyon]